MKIERFKNNNYIEVYDCLASLGKYATSSFSILLIKETKDE